MDRPGAAEAVPVVEAGEPAAAVAEPAAEPTPEVGDPESDAPAAGSNFVRFRRLDEDDGLLETAVTEYRDAAGRSVSLVSAVHIADPGHYQELSELFESYDKLLYELVAQPDDRPSPDDAARGGLSMIQRGMARGFELIFQMDGVDYRKDNFVHADLTPSAFAALQDERQEDFLTLIMRSMQAQLSGEVTAEGVADFDVVTAFREGYGRHLLRMTFATQIEDIERLSAGFAGPDGESALVEGRNARAVEVLDEQLAAGAKKLGIYYGAAHMPDFEKRLLARGFNKTGERWLVAWDCRKRPDSGYSSEAKRGESR